MAKGNFKKSFSIDVAGMPAYIHAELSNPLEIEMGKGFAVITGPDRVVRAYSTDADRMDRVRRALEFDPMFANESVVLIRTSSGLAVGRKAGQTLESQGLQRFGPFSATEMAQIATLGAAEITERIKAMLSAGGVGLPPHQGPGPSEAAPTAIEGPVEVEEVVNGTGHKARLRKAEAALA